MLLSYVKFRGYLLRSPLSTGSHPARRPGVVVLLPLCAERDHCRHSDGEYRCPISLCGEHRRLPTGDGPGPVDLQGCRPEEGCVVAGFQHRVKGTDLADGPLKLQERLVKEAQVAARAVTQRMTLPEVLISATAIGAEVSEALKTSESITSLGVEIMSLAVISIKPTPEMAKALEAGAREALQRKSDEAIYARRNAAVEQERRIKENELNTELAVEEKKRQIREAQMAAEIAIEEQRALLMDQKVANERKDADSRAYAMEVTAKAIETMDSEETHAHLARWIRCWTDDRTCLPGVCRERSED